MTQKRQKDWLEYGSYQRVLHPTKSDISLWEKESKAVSYTNLLFRVSYTNQLSPPLLNQINFIIYTEKFEAFLFLGGALIHQINLMKNI